jgi:hypothetical protein
MQKHPSHSSHLSNQDTVGLESAVLDTNGSIACYVALSKMILYAKLCIFFFKNSNTKFFNCPKNDKKRRMGIPRPGATACGKQAIESISTFLGAIYKNTIPCTASELHANPILIHEYATKEGCRTERKSRNLKYAMGVRLTRFTT